MLNLVSEYGKASSELGWQRCKYPAWNGMEQSDGAPPELHDAHRKACKLWGKIVATLQGRTTTGDKLFAAEPGE